jgi:hypothetical protein
MQGQQVSVAIDLEVGYGWIAAFAAAAIAPGAPQRFLAGQTVITTSVQGSHGCCSIRWWPARTVARLLERAGRDVGHRAPAGAAWHCS